jgi:hypothetical protein
MIMFHGGPLLKSVNEFIDPVFKAGLYNYCFSLSMYLSNLYSRKIASINPLDGYYSFNLYHMQPAFYLLLMTGVLVGSLLCSWCCIIGYLVKEYEVNIGWFANYFLNMAYVRQDYLIHNSPTSSLVNCQPLK